MAADKAKADAEKKEKEELMQENHHKMAQMDIDEDIDRAETAAQTIRTFAKLQSSSFLLFPLRVIRRSTSLAQLMKRLQ